MEKTNILKSIIFGNISDDYQVGSDEWLCAGTYSIYQGHEAAELIKEFCRKANPDNPGAVFKDRMLVAGLWPTWRTKDGKEKAVGVVKGKAEILRLFEGDRVKATGHYQWRILCAYEVLRVTISAEQSLQKWIAENEAETVDTTATAETATAETATAEKPVAALPAIAGEKVSTAIGILNRLLSTMVLDESAVDYIPFIRQALEALAGE